MVDDIFKWNIMNEACPFLTLSSELFVTVFTSSYLLIFIPYISPQTFALLIDIDSCLIVSTIDLGSYQGPFTSIVNWNSNIDQWLHPLWSVGWNYFSIPKFQRYNRLIPVSYVISWSIGPRYNVTSLYTPILCLYLFDSNSDVANKCWSWRKWYYKSIFSKILRKW